MRNAIDCFCESFSPIFLEANQAREQCSSTRLINEQSILTKAFNLERQSSKPVNFSYTKNKHECTEFMILMSCNYTDFTHNIAVGQSKGSTVPMTRKGKI